MRELFRAPLLRITLIGIMLGSIPLVGAWAASKWMIPWADQIGGVTQPDYKAMTQGWWAFGAILGSFAGGQIASLLGRRRSYFLISLGSMVLTIAMFQLTAPLQPSFFPIVFAQGFVATLFFGWLPLYLPELFPTHVRATGSGISYNVGRFATAGGVLAAGAAVHGLWRQLPGGRQRRGTDLRPGHAGDLVGAGHDPHVTGVRTIGRPRNTRHSMTHAPDRGNAGSRNRRGSEIVRAGSCLAALLLVAALGATGSSGQSAAVPALPTVPSELKVELFAREPMVRNPSAMAFDARGRLFVGQGPQYRNPKPDTPGDTVVILIDANRDGVADTTKTFASGLNSIQGLAWHGRDLWIGNSPDLTIVRDLDGDDRGGRIRQGVYRPGESRAREPRTHVGA